MKTEWHKYIIRCSRCSKPATIVDVFFADNFKINFDVICVACNNMESHAADVLEIEMDVRRLEGTFIAQGSDTIQ